MNNEKDLISVKSLYIHEILTLSHLIIEECKNIFNSFDSSAGQSYIHVDPKTQYRINSIIVNTGNLKKMFCPNKQKTHFDKREQHKQRVERGQFLTTLFNTNQFEEIYNIDPRNSIEHFDERIDILYDKVLISDKSLYTDKHIIYNMSLSNKHFLKTLFAKKPYYLKAYFVEEKTAYIDNEAINLEKIYDECHVISETALEILNIEDGPGGSIIILGEQT